MNWINTENEVHTHIADYQAPHEMYLLWKTVSLNHYNFGTWYGIEHNNYLIFEADTRPVAEKYLRDVLHADLIV